MSFDISSLITDRTQADVSQKTAKGTYNAEDLNRVGMAVEHLAERLRSAGVSVDVSPVINWTDNNWTTPSDMEAYLEDVRAMRSALALVESTPDAPADMDKFTYAEANDIEAILVALDAHITQMLSIVDAGWASGLAHTGFYFKEAD
jgi:hypothetical protein